MPRVHNTPMITVYRSGIINLNGEASKLMCRHHLQVDLLPPVNGRQGWQLDRRAGSPCNLLRGGRGSSFRFSAPYRAAELFRNIPQNLSSVCFCLAPATEGLELYALTQIEHLPLFAPTLQQNQKPQVSKQ